MKIRGHAVLTPRSIRCCFSWFHAASRRVHAVQPPWSLRSCLSWFPAVERRRHRGLRWAEEQQRKSNNGTTLRRRCAQMRGALRAGPTQIHADDFEKPVPPHVRILMERRGAAWPRRKKPGRATAYHGVSTAWPRRETTPARAFVVRGSSRRRPSTPTDATSGRLDRIAFR